MSQHNGMPQTSSTFFGPQILYTTGHEFLYHDDIVRHKCMLTCSWLKAVRGSL